MFKAVWKENSEEKTTHIGPIEEMGEIIKVADDTDDVSSPSVIFSNQTEDDKALYTLLLDYAYEKYKEDWCKQKNFDPKLIDEEVGINGSECYVSKNEFEYNEFEDEEYMENLLLPEMFVLYEYMWLNTDFDDETEADKTRRDTYEG